MDSRHWNNDRQMRATVIAQIGEGVIIKSIIIDRGHKNGPEIHKLSSTGIITIYNQYSGRMITKLIARPNQIRRYYSINEVIPVQVLEMARLHQKMVLNF